MTKAGNCIISMYHFSLAFKPTSLSPEVDKAFFHDVSFKLIHRRINGSIMIICSLNCTLHMGLYFSFLYFLLFFYVYMSACVHVYPYPVTYVRMRMWVFSPYTEFRQAKSGCILDSKCLHFLSYIHIVSLYKIFVHRCLLFNKALFIHNRK